MMTSLSDSNKDKIIYKSKKLIFNDSVFCPKKDAYFYDYPNGDLLEIYNLIEKSNYNFIFLYADWDARSSFYRELFLKLACDFYKEVTYKMKIMIKIILNF